jgi:Ca-activated chloride channel family protein
MFKRFVWVLLLSSVTALTAQSFSVRGKVVDLSGALLPGVKVTLQHKDSRMMWETVSSGDGQFDFAGVPAGDVELRAELPGFKTAVLKSKLGAVAVTDVSIMLHVASVAQTVEVQATGGVFNTSSATIGGGRVQRRDSGRVDRRPRKMNTESYLHIDENPFIRVSDDPRSTFATDVDTASYANVRRFLNDNQLPPIDAIRIEELVNYFAYHYDPPSGKDPIAIYTETANPFWAPKHRIVKIALRSRDIDIATRKPANLVFLIDVSGSMNDDMKLPLVQRSLHLLVNQLHDDDRIAMVVYAGSSGLVLPSTLGSEPIHRAIDKLQAGGSTNGGEGIQLAYATAAANYIQNGVNRVILATDGDFNVGVTNEGDLVRLIQDKASSRVSLTVLGFGIGNYKDSTLEKLADKGHGNYAYIDNFQEAKRVLVEQLAGTLLTVAKDVKLQIEFNPSTVAAYRLIGYENRLLEHADFDNDAKQGGDVGAGLSVTALYEVIPVGVPLDVPGAAPLKYQQPSKGRNGRKDELLTVSIRYKMPEGGKSTLLAVPVRDAGAAWESVSDDFRFAASVAAVGMVLRASPHKGTATFDAVLDAVEPALRGESSAYRSEFVDLVRKARALHGSMSSRE